MLYFSEKYSVNNLKHLANELAQNHFYNSVYEFLNERDKKIIKEGKGKIAIKDKILKKADKNGFKLLKLAYPKQEQDQDKKFNTIDGLPISQKASRNILILGAGATYNAFKNIPLAQEAQIRLQKNIIVKKFKASESKKISIDFYHFIEFFKIFQRKNATVKELEKNQYLLLDENFDEINKHLKNVFEKSDDRNILHEIASKYLSEYKKLLVTGSDSIPEKDLDFENSLNLLSQILPISTIRAGVQELYKIEDGPTLFYHIVAHLFKHRFIDVIINFNFDELLDKVLKEELGANSFDKIISDGDCLPLSSFTKNDRLLQPLYIKPHGTASHKSTLRFTKDQYHEIPRDLKILLEEVISTLNWDDDKRNQDSPKSHKRLNLITVGYDMASVEFNQILAENLKKEDQIFSFFFQENPGDTKELNKVIERKQELFSNLFGRNQEQPEVFLIGHEFFKPDFLQKKKKKEKDDFLKIEEIEKLVFSTSLDNTFLYLFQIIQSLYIPPFTPRNIYRHLVINEIFGNTVFWKRMFEDGDPEPLDKKERNDSPKYPKTYFQSPEYYKDRLIIEILIKITIDQGLINLFLLTQENTGPYYASYYKAFTEKEEETCLKDPQKERENPQSFNTILKNLSLKNYKKHEDFDNKIVDKNALLRTLIENCGNNLVAKKYDNLFDCFLNLLLSNDALFSEKLRNLLLYNIEKKNNRIKRIKYYFNNLYHSENIRITSNFRSTAYHNFENYNVKDIVSTELSLNYLFFEGIKDEKVDTICIIDDYGDQLAWFLKKIEELKPNIKIFLLLQDLSHIDSLKGKEHLNDNSRINSSIEKLKYHHPDVSDEWLKNSLIIRSQDLNQHNHHMTFFMRYQKGATYDEQAKTIKSGYYYYKQGLAHDVEIIRLTEEKNLKYLLKKFMNISGKIEKIDKEDGWLEILPNSKNIVDF